MVGPDFELPALDQPAPPEDSPASVRRSRAPRRPIVVATLALAAVVAAGGRWAIAPRSTSHPAILAPPTTVAAPSSAAQGPPGAVATTLEQSRVRTCPEDRSDEGPMQIRPPAAGGPQVTLSLSPRVSTDALNLIADALTRGRDALGDSGPVSLVVQCDMENYIAGVNGPAEEVRRSLKEGLPAQVSRGAIWIYGPNFDSPLFDQRRIIYHEYFHAVQRFLSKSKSTQAGSGIPLWLIEGSARYFENAVVEGNLDAFRKSQVRRWAALPSLAELEQGGGAKSKGGSGDAYTVGSVASDYLAAKYGQSRLQHDYWAALATTDWRSAFANVFGESVDDFYADFEAYRLTLRP
jgi:hypothetical protein